MPKRRQLHAPPTRNPCTRRRRASNDTAKRSEADTRQDGETTAKVKPERGRELLLHRDNTEEGKSQHHHPTPTKILDKSKLGEPSKVPRATKSPGGTQIERRVKKSIQDQPPEKPTSPLQRYLNLVVTPYGAVHQAEPSLASRICRSKKRRTQQSLDILEKEKKKWKSKEKTRSRRERAHWRRHTASTEKKASTVVEKAQRKSFFFQVITIIITITM